MTLPEKVEKRRTFIINFLYFLIVATLVFFLLKYVVKWAMPFLLAFIVAFLLQKPLKWLVRKTKGGRKFFSVALVIVMVLVLAGLVVLISWRLFLWVKGYVMDQNSVNAVKEALKGIASAFQGVLNHLSDSLSDDAVASVTEAISSLTDKLIAIVTGWFGSLASWAINITQSLPMMLVSLIIWIVASVFCTIDYDQIVSFFMRQLPAKGAHLVDVTRNLFKDTLFKVLRAYLLLMCITFAELSVGLLILRVENAVLLAALIAVIDILPVLGVGTVLIPWALISLIMGNYGMFIGLGITYIVITVVRNVLEPRIVSRQIGLNPLVTLFFMFLGLKSIGVAGIFLFPVTVMVIKELQDAGHIHIWK